MLLWHGQFPFCHSLMSKKFVSHPNHSIRVCVKGKRSNLGAEYGLEIPTEHCAKSVRIRGYLLRIFPHSD